MFGTAALDENGIAHTRNFSAVMEMTRCPDLATILNDCGLGMMLLDKEVAKKRLKFGVLKETREGDMHRVGFRLEEEATSGEVKAEAGSVTL